MPYVNIPDSKLVFSIAKIVGKIEGDIVGKVLVQGGALEAQFKSIGCPSDLKRTRAKKNSLQSAINGIDGRIGKFRNLPKKLKGPISGLKAALKIILSLPIPQAVPPGIGLPINITTKYADLLHLLKEFVRQISDDIDALNAILSGPSGQLKSISRMMSNVEFALKACEIEKALQDKIDDGTLAIEQLTELGIVDEGELILSSLGPQLLSAGLTIDNRSVSEMAEETGLSQDKVYANILQVNNPDLPSEELAQALRLRSKFSDGAEDSSSGETSTGAIINLDTDNNTPEQVENISNTNLSTQASLAKSKIVEVLTKLGASNIQQEVKDELKGLLDTFKEDSPKDKTQELVNTKYTHYGPDGTLYTLEITDDPNSPPIAPLRFAIARNPQGIQVLKGQKSFSSSADVLLDEIKFRIDNQLP